MLTLFYAGFIAFITVLVVLDLFVLHRREHVIGIREAMGWSAVWVCIALAFNGLVYMLYGHNWLGFTDAHATTLSGHEAALSFLNAYLLELSLSMDNLFVFATILAFFGVPLSNQHRVLVWGILGAILLRGVMIGAGAALVHALDWIIYVFGGLLIVTAIRMLMPGGDEIQPERNIIVRLARRWFPITTELNGNRFFVQLDGVRHMTPMFLALILVDIADVMFAIDSIPAAFGVFPPGRADTFIVFTSNICAIMGLRSMYFALVGMMDRFRYLKPAVVLLLLFIGIKMLLPMVSHSWEISNAVQLSVILGILATGVILSLAVPPGAETPQAGAGGADVNGGEGISQQKEVAGGEENSAGAGGRHAGREQAINDR